jgi:DNA (cytosine-5)-methyltransferase 1
MKILNLYAGIGGNRKLWGDEHEITAVELNPDIAKIYQDFFPNDKMVVGDAHQYLLDHYKEFDFIWSSPPCPTHSNARFWSSKGGMYDVEYPDMVLYQEILLLKHYAECQWTIENVKPFYAPLIEAKEIGRHLFWANFHIPRIDSESNYIFGGDDKGRVSDMLGFDLSTYVGIDETKLLRNCVSPETGLHILNMATGAIPPIQEGLFERNNK